MTPSYVRAARHAHRAASGDLYGASDLPTIIHRATEEVGIRQQCDQLQIIPKHLPDFTVSCGYEWVTQPESYDSTAEAAFQRRALMMLGKLWAESSHHERLVEKISKIIVTQEFVTKFGLCSPRITPSRAQVDYRILSIPSGFVELATWVFSGLRCWAARELGLEADDANDGGWTIACTPTTGRDARSFLHVTTNELIARTLADAGRDLEVYGDNAALLIREQVSELSGETGELDTSSFYDFEQNASYMVTEFAIAHEIGHALSPLSAATGAEDEMSETEAHQIACSLLTISAATRVFGWGTKILSPMTQAAVGVALFKILLEARQTLTTSLLRRASLTPEGNFTELNRLEMGRARCARDISAKTIAEVLAAGHADDAERLWALVQNGESYLGDLRSTIDGVSDAAVSQALAIAERSVQIP